MRSNGHRSPRAPPHSRASLGSPPPTPPPTRSGRSFRPVRRRNHLLPRAPRATRTRCPALCYPPPSRVSKAPRPLLVPYASPFELHLTAPPRANGTLAHMSPIASRRPATARAVRQARATPRTLRRAALSLLRAYHPEG